MTETAGWGTPAWLPPGVVRRQAQEDAREALESKRAAAERELRAEERHAAAMELYREQAEARGEVLDVMAMARGEVRGRSVEDILAAAVAASVVEDRCAEMRAWQQGHGEPEKLHVEFVDDPVLLAPAARSSIGLRIFNRARRFGEAQRTRAAAEAAARASANDYGFVCERRSRDDDDPVVAVTASRRRGGMVPADSGLRFR
jgi:hypothetical protein